LERGFWGLYFLKFGAPRGGKQKNPIIVLGGLKFPASYILTALRNILALATFGRAGVFKHLPGGERGPINLFLGGGGEKEEKG